jgi:integrase
VQYVHVTLFKALKQALRWELVPRNVCASVEPPRLDKKEITPLTADQVNALLKVAEGDPLRALYWVAVTTGLRQGELLALSWADVDLEGNVLRVRRTLVANRGKLTFSQPKTVKARRAVALKPGVVAELREHRKRQKQVGAWKEYGLVFCTRKGTPINPSNLVKRSFKPLLKRARLPEIRFHDLRHTAATLMLSGGVHPKIVQEILGHAQISMTLDTYSHVLPGMQQKAVNAITELLVEGLPGE